MSDPADADERLDVVPNATVYYYENDPQNPVRYEGKVEIYHGWVHFVSAQGGWVPREQIEQIHEF